MKFQVSATVLAACLCATHGVAAADAASRLQRIQETGTIVISHAEGSIPFSFVDAKGPQGFGVDLSKRIAAAVQKELGLQALKIRWNPVTLSTRFPMMVTNTVDLECATTTHTAEREKMVGFSNTFYIAREAITTRADSGIKDYTDLPGKRIAVVRGTSTEQSLRDRGVGKELVLERNNRRAMEVVQQGQADAYVAATPLMLGELLKLDDAKPFQVVGSGGKQEAYACVLPKDDPAFKRVVDTAIADMQRSGDMERLYHRWFQQSLPAFGRAINMPLSDENRQLYAAPNDRVLE
jgi:glutamate/aspartate transport system substrate-binding protein